MNSKRFSGILILTFAFAMGCSGDYGAFKPQTESQSKVIKRDLLDNWSNYDIWLFYPTGYRPPQLTGIIFDPNNDDRKILAGSDWLKVKDQQLWNEVVKENTTSDGDFKILRDVPEAATSTVKEIRGSDNQLYGYAIISASHFTYPRMVEENTMRIDTLGRASGSYL